MTVKDVKIYNYQLSLRFPLSIHGRPLEKRRGLIVQFIDANNNSGFGDICPLPGLSRETLEEAQRQITLLRKKILHEELPSNAERLNGLFTKWLDEFEPCASVRFGFEMATLTLSANQQKKTLGALLSGNNEHAVPVSGLLHGTRDEILNDARWMVAEGYSSFKLKVGTGPLNDDIDATQAVNEVINGKALLRLDANRQWSFEQAVEFARAVGPLVEYIEEPFADTERIPEFYHQTLIPIALDESLQTLKMERIKSIEGVEVLILKPTVLGGFETARQWISQAEEFGLRVVLSSSFESGPGLAALASLAASSCHGVAMGLDTGKWFLSDLLIEPIKIDHGIFNLSENTFKTSSINFSNLREISCVP